jgi:hypothetical protein
MRLRLAEVRLSFEDPVADFGPNRFSPPRGLVMPRSGECDI